MTVVYEIQKETTQASMMLVDGVTSCDVVALLTTFRPIGLWRLGLESGHLFWSREVFEIYDMPYSTKPVSLVEINSRFHPDDLSIRLELLERAAKLKTSFSYTLRIRTARNDYRFIRAAGRYRETADGYGEFIGAMSIVDTEQLPSSRIMESQPIASA